jgi:hypothetical protein
MEYVILGIVGLLLAYHFLAKSTNDTPVKPVAKKPAKKVPSQSELKKLTKVQLIQLADKENLKVKVSGSKAEVIKSIHSQMK